MYNGKIIAIIANYSFAQNIELSPSPSNVILLTSINPLHHTLSATNPTNLLSQYGYFNQEHVFIDYGKNVMVVRNDLLRKDNNRFLNVEASFLDEHSSEDMYLSANGKWLIFVSYLESTNSMDVKFYNIERNVLTTHFQHPVPFRSGIQLNSDASIFVFTDHPRNGNQRLYVVERHAEIFKSTVVEKDDVNPSNLHLSSTGDRIIFMTGNIAIGNKHFFVDRTKDGWTVPKEIQIDDSPLQIGGDGIMDIANNGKTILFQNEDQKPAVAYEDSGIWVVPQQINYTFQHEEGRYSDRFQIAETGNVIAIQSLKDSRLDGFIEYFDAFIYFKTLSGSWVSRQVNPEEVNVLPDIHLTDDGTQLFWMSEGNKMSIPFAEQLK